MGLPWVRLDANISSHDKILDLLSDPSPKKWQAAFSYCASLAYAGGHGTDGQIKKTALPFVHGTEPTARLLCRYRLWEADDVGWWIINYGERQQLKVVSDAHASKKREASKKGNCVRHHGPQCGCWERSA